MLLWSLQGNPPISGLLFISLHFFPDKKRGERVRETEGDFLFMNGGWLAGWLGAAAVGRRWVLWKLYPPHHGRI